MSCRDYPRCSGWWTKCFFVNKRNVRDRSCQVASIGSIRVNGMDWSPVFHILQWWSERANHAELKRGFRGKKHTLEMSLKFVSIFLPSWYFIGTRFLCTLLTMNWPFCVLSLYSSFLYITKRGPGSTAVVLYIKVWGQKGLSLGKKLEVYRRRSTVRYCFLRHL